MNDAERFIEEEVPAPLRAVLPRALRNAYGVVDMMIGENPFLQVESGRMSIRGYLLPLAVDFALQGLIDRGEWPFSYGYEYHGRPTGKHLKIYTPNSVITVSQVQDEDVQPRRAVFRANYSLSNQELFEFEAAELARSVARSDGRKHLILGHGYQELDFIHIGVPSPDGQGYLASTGNILNGIYDATPNLVPVEEVGSEEIVTLKQRLERKLEANGD